MSGFVIKRRNDNTEQRELLVKTYQEKIINVIRKIPRGLSFEEKVGYLYEYLVNEIDYDYACLERNSGIGTVYPSVFDDDEKVPEEYRNIGTTADCESSFLHKKALCVAISKIFRDLCKRAGIKCEICEGKTAVVDNTTGIRRSHVWNIVEDEYGRRSHVDVTYGIFVKDHHEFKNCDGRKIEDFCMVSDEELSLRGPHTITTQTQPCNYTVYNHKQIQENLLKRLNCEEKSENREL